MLWWLWLACGGAEEPETTPTDSGMPVETPAWIGGCGLPEYPLLPTSDVGAVVAVEEATDLSMNLATIELTLALAGLPSEAFDVRYDVKTWRVRYVSQDRGEPVEGTMLVSFPVGAGEVPTFAWLHGTTGFTDACAPSAMGLEGGAFNLLFASLGYVVVAPDYLGMNGFGEPAPFLHPYLVPEVAALGSLDAVRAAWSFVPEEDVGASASRELVWFGASEGGFTALWADRYQPHYLPEAEPVAVVASVPPADLPSIAVHALTVFEDATLGLLGGLLSWHDWYRVAQPLSEAVPAALAEEAQQAIAADCSIDIAEEPTTVDGVFTQAYIDATVQGDATAFPELSCAMEKGRLVASDVPRANDTPVLYIVAELDTLVSAAPTREAYGPLCDVGYRMNYIECEGADHVDGAVWSLPEAVAWAADRVDGLPLEDVCSQGAAVVCSLDDRGTK